MPGIRSALLGCGLLTSLVAACAGPAEPTIDPQVIGPPASSSGPTSAPPTSESPAEGTTADDPTAADDTADGGSGGGGTGGGGGNTGGGNTGGGSGGGNPGSGSGGGNTGGGSGGGNTGSGSGGSQASSSGSSTGRSTSAGTTTKPSPLAIPEFNIILGASWTQKEREVRKGIADACGDHGASCASVAVLVEEAPGDAGSEDCAIWDLRYPEPFYPGDTYTVVINDECGGAPPATGTAPLTIPDFNDIERASWTAAQSGVYAAVASICGDLGPDCVTVTTSVEPDPAWAGADDPDCAIRTYRTPDPLFPGGEIVIVLNDECGPG